VAGDEIANVGTRLLTRVDRPAFTPDQRPRCDVFGSRPPHHL